LRETPPPVDGRLDPPAGRVASDEPRELRPAQPSHLLDVAPQQALARPALLPVRLLNQNPLYPAVALLAVFALKADCLAGFDEPLNCFQTQLLCFVHADVHIPACLSLQAHLVLESDPPFRLILYWKRVALGESASRCYDCVVGTH